MIHASSAIRYNSMDSVCTVYYVTFCDMNPDPKTSISRDETLRKRLKHPERWKKNIDKQRT